ncbi:PREDICTED: follistatin-related protein 5-like [Branchiostoma belcheri]|uniref:Follistatin-related protein 5-like n=1 Tax=Branchiostoma belcheri TaxID=7741 RepID=A0A6P4Y6Y8_BRABE|nr:PREDICTED: follistatin-related protein 5-like [Branchiostoma belcheri]
MNMMTAVIVGTLMFAAISGGISHAWPRVHTSHESHNEVLKPHHKTVDDHPAAAPLEAAPDDVPVALPQKAYDDLELPKDKDAAAVPQKSGPVKDVDFKAQGLELAVDKEYEIDACSETFCGPGRHCRVSPESGDAECVCLDACRPHKKPVCGNDGKLYPNHCELHRMACVLKKRIAIAHNKDCFYQGDKNCTDEEYGKLKTQLLRLQNRKFAQSPDAEGLGQDELSIKKFLVTMMFEYWDLNNDGQVSSNDMREVMRREDELAEVMTSCTLYEMLKYDDINDDHRVDIDEFYNAFGVTPVHLSDEKKSLVTVAKVGDSLALRCDITGDPEPILVWQRHGVDLTTIDLSRDGITVFDDGTLYITSLSTLHMGNYTCRALHNGQVVQVHTVKVQVPPSTKVSPRRQAHSPGSTAELKCHAEGIPAPAVKWLKNGGNLDPSESPHVSLQDSGSVLHISNVRTEDMGAYICHAENLVGSSEDISTLFVQDGGHFSSLQLESVFYVFHDDGVNIFQPSTCQLVRHIKASDKILATQEPVCTPDMDGNQVCSWGSAVNVLDTYIYVSQPQENRVLVLETRTQQVVQVIQTDPLPVDLQYMEELDQVWVLNWGDMERSFQTLEVIREASAAVTHRTIHTEPVENHFDHVESFFLPPVRMLEQNFKYAYLVHRDQPKIDKMDVETMKYVRTIDLTEQNCHPQSLAFSAVSGYVVVQCSGIRDDQRHNVDDDSQVLLDALTDAVIQVNPEIHGKPHVSPDGRYIVSIDNESELIVVQSISEDGQLSLSFEVHTNLHVSDVAFHPTSGFNSYNLYVSSESKTDILFVNLLNGKVKMIKGVKSAMPVEHWPWDESNRAIISTGLFGNYLVSPSEEAIFVVDSKLDKVNCEIDQVKHGNVIVWVGEL